MKDVASIPRPRPTRLYDSIRDAILTCAQKLTWVSSIYRTEPTTKKWEHTHPFNGPFPGIPRWAGTRKVKPIWILLKQETVSGSGISCPICKSAPRSRQITTPAPYHSVFYRPDVVPAAQPTASKHWRPNTKNLGKNKWNCLAWWRV